MVARPVGVGVAVAMSTHNSVAVLLRTVKVWHTIHMDDMLCMSCMYDLYVCLVCTQVPVVCPGLIFSSAFDPISTTGTG